MDNDNEEKSYWTMGVFLLTALSAVITFFATCQGVTEVAVRIADPDPHGGALQGSYIFYGSIVGVPLGLTVAWLVARKVESIILKSKEKK